MARVKREAVVTSASASIHIRKELFANLSLLLVGTQPLIVHAWSPKAINIIRGKHTKEAAPPMEAKNPAAEFEAAKYKSPLGWEGVPAHGLKGCFTEGARFIGGKKTMNMTLLRGALKVKPDCVATNLLRVYSTEPARMREDLVSIGSGMNETVDLRYRPEYWPWALRVKVLFPATMFSNDQVADLIRAAGSFNGFGEWRPGSPKSVTGMYGTFEIGEGEQIAEFERTFQISVDD
jgi:hypothetical protein